MDAYSRATPDSRARGRRKVLAVTGGTGVAALAVTGCLAVGLSQGTTSAAGTSSTNDSGSTSSDSTGSSSVTGGSSGPVVTSGGS